MKYRIATGLLAVAVATLPALRASEINNSATGLTSPTETIDFTEVPLADGTALTNQFAAYGVTFSNLWYSTVYDFGTSIVAPEAANFSIGCPCVNPYSIFFSTPQTDVAFGLVTNSGDNTTITALLGGSVVDSFTATTDLSGNFFGFTGLSGGFDQIQLSTQDNVDGAAVIDTIELGTAIPEPASWVLLALGTASLAVVRRFRRQ
jgi:hypothetical protein